MYRLPPDAVDHPATYIKIYIYIFVDGYSTTYKIKIFKIFILQQLNALNKGEEENDTICVAEMKSLAGYDDSLKEVADYQFYIAYDFYPKNNTHFHKSPYYSFYQSKYN